MERTTSKSVLVESAQSNITLNFAPDQSRDAQIFHVYTCTSDCSGHLAGYEWAEKKDIDDADACTGNSQSFIEGCETYVEEQEIANAEDNE